MVAAAVVAVVVGEEKIAVRLAVLVIHKFELGRVLPVMKLNASTNP